MRTIIQLFLTGMALSLFTTSCYAYEILNTFTDQQGKEVSYATLLEQHKLAGLSMAVIDNYEIVYQHTAGVKEFGKNQAIDDKTAFSTASISKPITATIAAMLAEQGKLDLDAPAQSYLKRWEIPRSTFNQAHDITIRELLSHTAGTSQGGFADFYLGDDIPNVIESLNGEKLPRYKQPIEVLFTPGTSWRYSGGGYVIVQVLLEDVTNKPLAQLAEEMIFSPLAMRHTTMYQHGHAKFLNNVAKVHDDNLNVIGTGIPICPQVAPSGMWSTPTDMAKFVLDYQRALNNKNPKVISPWVAKQTVQIQTLDVVGGWSPGWMRFEGQGNLDWFSHGGSNTGTGGQLMGTLHQGRGIAILANGSNKARMPVIQNVIENVITKLKWRRQIDEVESQPSQEVMQSMVGRYLSDFDGVMSIKKSGNSLVFQGRLVMWSFKQSGTLHFQGENKFVTDNLLNNVSLERNPEDGKEYLSLTRKGTNLVNYGFKKLDKKEQLPFEMVQKDNFQIALAAYQAWKKSHPKSLLASENAINRAGYQSIKKGELDIALTFMRIQTHLYPNSANAFDSLAETYNLLGNITLAKQHYLRSLELNPNNQAAMRFLAELGSH